MKCDNTACNTALTVGEGVGLAYYGLPGTYCLSCARQWFKAYRRAHRVLVLGGKEPYPYAKEISGNLQADLQSLGAQSSQQLPARCGLASAPPTSANVRPQKLLPARCLSSLGAQDLKALPASQLYVVLPELGRHFGGWFVIERNHRVRANGKTYGPYTRLVHRHREKVNGRTVTRKDYIRSL